MGMNSQIEEAEVSILHTYNRFPVVFDRGEGVYLYDTEGKKYLDFAAGIAVNSLGYHYPGYDEGLKEQIDKLTHISNLYYTVPMAEAGAKLLVASGMNKAFFTNSGAEAIEGALKAASYTPWGDRHCRTCMMVPSLPAASMAWKTMIRPSFLSA